ncbi:MAG: acyl-CoA dehydrogenase family protein [Dehalococcoidia bacterium]
MDLDLELSPEDEAFQQEVRRFLDGHIPPNWGKPGHKQWSNEPERIAFLKDWQRQLHAAGLAAIAWPVEFGGRGASVMQQILYSDEMARRNVPDVINRGAILQIGPAIIQWGTEEQREYFLPRILNAEILWCQGFSEPDAGSDLASMKTRAVADGDEFVIDGSKIWTSRADIADWCLLLTRTDPEAPKHRGISCFILDMKTPGITIQPLKQISGPSGFNQVFFDGVRVPRSAMLGGLNEGWRVATTTLRYERAGTSTTRAERRLQIVTKLARETLIDGRPRIEDPLVRDRLARFSAIVEALRQIGWRSIVGGLRGTPPGPETSIAKLLWSETDQAMADFGMDLLGPYGILQAGSPHAVKDGNPALSYLIMRAATIGGGTSEVQRNIIGERVLGLPRD